MQVGCTLRSTKRRRSSGPPTPTRQRHTRSWRRRCALTLRQIERKDPDVWIYRPKRHKNAWRGHVREIVIGPRARAIIEALLTANPDAPLFRQLDMLRGHPEAKPKRAPAEPFFTTPHVADWIGRGCRAAGVPVFTPHQIRHAAEKRVEDETGDIDTTRVVAGQKDIETARRYAKGNLDKAREWAKKFG